MRELLSALNKIIQNADFKKKVSLEEHERLINKTDKTDSFKEDRSLT